jgi:hypothetical protein
MELTINPEFHDLIPPMSPDEYQLLEDSIVNEGCRDAIVTWDECIVDGHRRHEICHRHNIGHISVEKEFTNKEEAKIWIINNQLARRNLTSEQMSNLRGMRYNLEKKEDGGRSDRDISGGQNGHPKTAERIGQETGVSASTIKRDAKFAEALDKLPSEEKVEILAGKSKKTKKEIIGIKKSKRQKAKLDRPYSNGMRFAKMAILDLEQITDDDLERAEAFAFVKQWIKDHERRKK